MKYIVFNEVVNCVLQDVIILFPKFITHKEMARKIRKEVISAGVAEIEPGVNPSCYGYSQSLHVGSRVETDSILLRSCL